MKKNCGIEFKMVRLTVTLMLILRREDFVEKSSCRSKRCDYREAAGYEVGK